MNVLAEKIVDAFAQSSEDDPQSIGLALKRLRKMSGLTQVEMAKRLDVQQGAVSKIEKGGDALLSTISKFVEALGARLKLDATFPSDSPLSANIQDAFDVEYGNDNQLVLPLLGDEPFKAQRDVVLSIKPQYSQKILDGFKTVELRRRFPVSAPKGTVAYIYSTSPVRAMVGMAEIRGVLKLPIDQIWQRFEDVAHIEKTDFDRYFEGVEHGFALVFSEVRAFSKPLPLAELREKFGFEPPQSFLYAKHNLRKALQNEPAIVSN